VGELVGVGGIIGVEVGAMAVGLTLHARIAARRELDAKKRHNF
jgi:hypothetical protein